MTCIVSLVRHVQLKLNAACAANERRISGINKELIPHASVPDKQ